MYCHVQIKAVYRHIFITILIDARTSRRCKKERGKVLSSFYDTKFNLFDIHNAGILLTNISRMHFVVLDLTLIVEFFDKSWKPPRYRFTFLFMGLSCQQIGEHYASIRFLFSFCILGPDFGRKENKSKWKIVAGFKYYLYPMLANLFTFVLKTSVHKPF